MEESQIQGEESGLAVEEGRMPDDYQLRQLYDAAGLLSDGEENLGDVKRQDKMAMM